MCWSNDDNDCWQLDEINFRYKRSMRVKLSVVVISQLFSIFILLTGMVWIDLGCKVRAKT